jgi:hypothetical protein
MGCKESVRRSVKDQVLDLQERLHETGYKLWLRDGEDGSRHLLSAFAGSEPSPRRAGYREFDPRVDSL